MPLVGSHLSQADTDMKTGSENSKHQLRGHLLIYTTSVLLSHSCPPHWWVEEDTTCDLDYLQNSAVSFDALWVASDSLTDTHMEGQQGIVAIDLDKLQQFLYDIQDSGLCKAANVSR